jgi:hypothetical protein
MPLYTPTTDLGWRGVVYRAGYAAQIPDDLAHALGLTGVPAKSPQGKAAAPAAASIPAALKLINGVDVVRELQVIPTIGAGAAKAILAARPDGGYSSLAQVWELCPKILSSPYTTDPEQVATWGGVE